MTAVLGRMAVTVGFVAALAGVTTLGLGLRRRSTVLLHAGRRYLWVVLPAAVVAVVAMEVALIGHDFSLAYVATNASRTTPLLYTVASLWGALEGSILLWALVLAGYLGALGRRFRAQAAEPLVSWAFLIGLVIATFFFGLMVGPANPFREVAGPVPTDGPGPNPLLQNHPLMAVHPPMLYLGYVGFTVPFAFALAALVTGQAEEGWLAATRRWTLVAWGFLTVGIVLGAWWSYEVLGWGGFWAWDPVENASLLPWLTATAFVHSVMVQERRGMLRIWNLSLLLATFSLTIFGTFLTRSGVLDSVHAFTESAIGPSFLGFFALVVAVSVALIGWRGDRLRGPGSIESPISREGAFLANNLGFAAFAFVVLLGTVFPLVIEALSGERLAVGRPYFDRMTMPIGFALLFLMAVAPLLPWRRTSGELVRHRLAGPAWVGTLTVVGCVVAGLRGLAPLLAFGLAAFAATATLRQLVVSARRTRRANGGLVVHLGVVLIAVAFAASQSYASDAEFRLRPGESATLAGHTLTYLGSKTIERPHKTSVVARVRVDGDRVFAPALHTFPFATQAIGSPSVRTGLVDDVYLTLLATPKGPGEPAVIGVIIQPLILWLWVGGGLMALGTALAVWPRRRRRQLSGARSEPASGTPEALPASEPAVVGS